MTVALAEAERAAAEGEVPVGAVVIAGGRMVAQRHNERESRHDPTAHAEMLALRDAAAVLGRWRLLDATVVVTLEPCPMCAGALVAARVGGCRVRRRRPARRCLRVALQPLRRPPHEPRGHRDARREGGRGGPTLLEHFFTERRERDQ